MKVNNSGRQGMATYNLRRFAHADGPKAMACDLSTG
jgi:hypothetical protein